MGLREKLQRNVWGVGVVGDVKKEACAIAV